MQVKVIMGAQRCQGQERNAGTDEKQRSHSSFRHEASSKIQLHRATGTFGMGIDRGLSALVANVGYIIEVKYSKQRQYSMTAQPASA